MYKKIIIPTFALLLIFIITFMSLSNKSHNTTPDTEPIGTYKPVIVLELFTSQGCSSCPPADVLLNKVKQQYPDKVFALSYHVDYWNYIGWEDPFSQNNYTKKQRFYNQKFHYRSNYTPQLVVNGKEHFVGSNSAKLTSKIIEYGKLQAINNITISSAKQNNNSIAFSYEVKGELADKELRAVLVLDERITSVKRGENRNRTLKNSNIVVTEQYFKLNAPKGKGVIQIPTIVAKNDSITLLLVTENEVADITGAAKVSI